MSVSTNFEPLLHMVGAWLRRPQRWEGGVAEADFRFWVDPSSHSNPPWPKPYFRGLGHLIFAGFDTYNSMLIDLRSRRVMGRLTVEIAEDAAFWKIIILPVLLAILGSAAGLAVLHCACVAWKDTGILLAGHTGSGKSTLSLALAQSGFVFVSDDRTLFSIKDGLLLAHGLGPCLKLRREAAARFGSLGNHLNHPWPNEEGDAYIDPSLEFGVERAHTCEPQSVFFLEQGKGSAFSVVEITPDEAGARLEEGLTQETVEAVRNQREVIGSLVRRECFLLRYAGDPTGIAWALRGFLATRFDKETGHRKPAPLHPRSRALRQDPLRRFTPTPLSAGFRLMRRHVRLETNSELVLEHSRRALCRYEQATSTLPDFRWRVVSDSKGTLEPPWPEMTAFSDRTLRFINLGQQSFIAVDTDCREAAAFISENLVKDETGFASIVLSSLFYLSAAKLGLTAVSAACIAREGKGLLLFGVPRSGKTTSCFIASGQGYRFHADQACFLEVENGVLQAWGDFWPAAFHPEALRFFPELAECVRPLIHQGGQYLCIEKDSSRPGVASSVVPVACVFLEREAADAPRLIPISERNLPRLLEQGVPFKDNSGPDESRQPVLSALRRLPAYRLLYGDSPAVPSLFFHSLLQTHEVMERMG